MFDVVVLRGPDFFCELFSTGHCLVCLVVWMYVYIYSPDMDIQKYTVTMKIIVNSVKISSPIGTISNSEVVDLQ